MNYLRSAKITNSLPGQNVINFNDFEIKPTNYIVGQHGSSILEINLGAIVHNFNFLKKTYAKTDIFPVLKSNAYGLGAIPIASALHKAGANCFFVAYIEEALSLREHLPNATLYVLNGPYDGDWTNTCYINKITPVLNTYESIETWHKFAKSLGIKLNTALHINTGMHRLGLSASDLKRLLEADFSYIRWSLIMTQLACADEPTHPMNIKQKTLFNSLRPHFKDAKFSLVDTKGILLGPDYHYDVIRPGRALYGPLCGYENHSLMQCITIKAKILQIQELNPGQTIGYGCTFTANKCMKIATLSLGYTDGLSRRLSGRNAYAVINGKKAPFVGRISMDLTTVDITDIPNVNMYDWATIAGNDAMAIDDIAQLINTDSREVLVTLGDRFNKFYTE